MWVMSIIKKGEKFYYQFMAYGIRKHGLCRGCKTETEAKAYEGKIRDVLDDVHRGKKGQEEFITFGDILDNYLKYSEINKKDYRHDESRVKIIKEYFNVKNSISNIKPSDIELFKSKIMSDRGLSPATVNRYIVSISKAFNLIINDKQLNMVNPCNYVKKFKENSYKERYLTEDEEERLMQELSPHIKPIVICALTTGLRKSNILNLKWEQIDIKKKFIEINKQDNKGHKKIQIPIAKKLMNCLKEIGIKEKGYVFINPETNQPYTDIKKGFNKACERAKIEGLRFHDLRHTVGTRLVASGVDILTVKEILAHSSIQTTQRYSHPVKENIKKAVDILNGFI